MKDREPKFVGDLFPISNASIKEALTKLKQAENQQKEYEIMQKHYPLLRILTSGHLKAAKDPRVGVYSTAVLLGSLLGFKALRYEAFLRSGQLPPIEENAAFREQADDVLPFIHESATDTDVTNYKTHQIARDKHFMQKEGAFLHAVNSAMPFGTANATISGIANVYALYNQPPVNS